MLMRCPRLTFQLFCHSMCYWPAVQVTQREIIRTIKFEQRPTPGKDIRTQMMPTKLPEAEARKVLMPAVRRPCPPRFAKEACHVRSCAWVPPMLLQPPNSIAFIQPFQMFAGLARENAHAGSREAAKTFRGPQASVLRPLSQVIIVTP